jgi:hypothetical protein
LPQKSLAGEWFLRSGIQEPSGGVARYHRTDLGQNAPVSTEITGYAVSALAWAGHLDAARAAADYLCRIWNPADRTMPFEEGAPSYAYFFDNGIIVRGLLAAWRKLDDPRYLETAAAIGRHMARDFDAGADFHPILALPSKQPLDRDPLRWSRSPGCYQLKSAMAWLDLADATGDASFVPFYDRVLDYALRTWRAFLPGHPERAKVMDRLHAFSYFLEGLLPRARDPRCCGALHEGVRIAASLLRDIAPEFDRSDVYAQILRVRVYADRAGVLPLDRAAAAHEAERLREFQTPGGGFRFGRRGAEWLPYSNPVSTAFGMQALALWSGETADVRDLV